MHLARRGGGSVAREAQAGGVHGGAAPRPRAQAQAALLARLCVLCMVLARAAVSARVRPRGGGGRVVDARRGAEGAAHGLDGLLEAEHEEQL